MSVARDRRFLAHQPGPGHPERPERLLGIEAELARAVEAGLVLEDLPIRAATREEVLRAHAAAHVDRIDACRGRIMRLDPDTGTSEGSVEAAYLAAGAAIDMARRVASGGAPGMALVRPPGHHATEDRAMGFCLYNHVAIAAHALLAEGLAERIAIYDWDVHHGNGTQDIFYADPRVMYLSTHQHPQYPGTGDPLETGKGNAEGTNVNVRLAAGTDDAELLEASRSYLIPTVRDFSPDVILISAGFDAHKDDPVGGLSISVEGFRSLAKLWRDAAESMCDGRITAVLEGGYHIEATGASARAVLEAFAGR